MKEVLLVLLNEYADWESAFLAAGLRSGGRYVPRVVGPTREAVGSIGGSGRCRITISQRCRRSTLRWC